jgi:hypothetical protein
MGCRWMLAIQKRMRICLAYKAEANQNLDLWPWLSRSEYHKGEFCCQGKCVAYTNENFLVFFYFSRQTKSNLGKIASYTSHNILHLTISLPLSLILRERGRHELPSFSLLIFCGYWQGSIFFRLGIFFRCSFYVQIDVLQFVSRVRFYAKLNLSNLYVMTLY